MCNEPIVDALISGQQQPRWLTLVTIIINIFLQSYTLPSGPGSWLWFPHSKLKLRGPLVLAALIPVMAIGRHGSPPLHATQNPQTIAFPAT